MDRALRNAPFPMLCLLNFTVIGFLAATFLALLSNCKGSAQLSFGNHLLMTTVATLLEFKIATIWGSLRASAQGGLLTPCLTCGTLLACFLRGAGTCLAAPITMPLTTIGLIFEFINLTLNFLPPIIVTITSAMCLFKFCQSRAAPSELKDIVPVLNDTAPAGNSAPE